MIIDVQKYKENYGVPQCHIYNRKSFYSKEKVFHIKPPSIKFVTHQLSLLVLLTFHRQSTQRKLSIFPGTLQYKNHLQNNFLPRL